MGTNYYMRIDPCKYCGSSNDILHIGKLSGGWTFSFQAHDNIKSFKELIKFINSHNAEIYDEYEKKISLNNFKELVKSSKNEKHNHTKEYPEGSFLDEEGNSFSEGEFS